MQSVNSDELFTPKYLPKAFTSRLLGYLSVKERSNLAGVNRDWARRIIRVDPGLKAVKITSQSSWTWLQSQVTAWQEALESLLPKNPSYESYSKFPHIYTRVFLCHNVLNVRLEEADQDLFAVVCKRDKLQAVIHLVHNDKERVAEIETLLASPYNSVEQLRSEGKVRSRGAGTVAVAAGLTATAYPLALVSLKGADSFYQRLGFEKLPESDDGYTHKMRAGIGRGRLRHVKVSWMPEEQLKEKQTEL